MFRNNKILKTEMKRYSQKMSIFYSKIPHAVLST